MLSAAEEFANPQAHLHRVDSRIRCRQACVRDVHVAQFEADVALRAEDVHSQRGLVHEVDGVGSGGNVVVGEQRAAGEFQVGREASVALEVPLEAERVEAHAVGGVGRLEDQEDRNSVDRIFEASAEKAGEMRAGEDPSIAQAGVEGACVAASAADGVAAARPDLNFVAALLRTGLGNDEDRRSSRIRSATKERIVCMRFSRRTNRSETNDSQYRKR